MLKIPDDYPLHQSFGGKLIASVQHLADHNCTHNRSLDVALLQNWLDNNESALTEYQAKHLPAWVVEPLENAVRLAKAGIACGGDHPEINCWRLL